MKPLFTTLALAATVTGCALVPRDEVSARYYPPIARESQTEIATAHLPSVVEKATAELESAEVSIWRDRQWTDAFVGDSKTAVFGKYDPPYLFTSVTNEKYEIGGIFHTTIRVVEDNKSYMFEFSLWEGYGPDTHSTIQIITAPASMSDRFEATDDFGHPLPGVVMKEYDFDQLLAGVKRERVCAVTGTPDPGICNTQQAHASSHGKPYTATLFVQDSPHLANFDYTKDARYHYDCVTDTPLTGNEVALQSLAQRVFTYRSALAAQINTAP
jgi:hypothetical protein